jgi:hypothetical protein
MLCQQAMPILSTSNRSSHKSQRNTRIGLSIAGSAVAYPFLVYAIVWSHDALAHSELRKGTEATLLLVACPMCIACVFSMVILIADGRGKKRVAGVIGSLIGMIVNVLFLLANGTV